MVAANISVFPPSMQNVLPSLALSPEDDAVEEVTLQEKEKLINISYELAAEASKRSKLVAGRRPHRERGHAVHVAPMPLITSSIWLTLVVLLCFTTYL